jgi:hypothetical protein
MSPHSNKLCNRPSLEKNLEFIIFTGDSIIIVYLLLYLYNDKHYYIDKYN